MNKIKTPHICGVCGKQVTEIPQDAREGLESRDEYPGFYWECSGLIPASGEACKSTLFVKKARVEAV